MLRLTGRASRYFRRHIENRSSNTEERKRFETLDRVAHYAVNVVVLVVAGMLLLDELGISIAPILATAGVLGIAIGFGAQSLVKDYFSGFFSSSKTSYVSATSSSWAARRVW